jgi:tRNA threonylcarbamoyladenosine biosynthesis protein TsaB
LSTLGIETSTARGSVAIIENGELVFSEQFSADRSAGLFVCLESAAPFLPACTRIAVGLGPGSYSGVRVAIAAAIGLNFTNPQSGLCGVSSFAALETPEEDFFVVGDARRGGFYFAHFAEHSFLAGPMLLPLDAMQERISAQPALSIFASTSLPDIPRAQLAFPSAERIARLAASDHAIFSRNILEPIYLREPVITRADTQPRP